MSYFKTKDVKIKRLAVAVPRNRRTSEEFVETFGKEEIDKFEKATGIHSIHCALPEQTAGDLGYEAAEYLFERTKIPKELIGSLVFVTQSPDYRRPATACVLQKRLCLSEQCAAMDVGLGCSGFIYGLQVAQSLLMNSDLEYSLLIIGETASKVVNPHDRTIAMMFGDAGAAVLLQRAPYNEMTALLKTDGSRYKSIILPAGGFRDMNPSREAFLCSDGIERTKYDVFMDGLSVFSFSISDVPETIAEYLKYTDTQIQEYDLCVLHQANRFIINQIRKKIGCPKEKVPVSLDRYGNTGGVSIPLTLCDYLGGTESGIINILAAGFGIGLSWGVTSFALDAADVCPIIETDRYFAEGKIEKGMI